MKTRRAEQSAATPFDAFRTNVRRGWYKFSRNRLSVIGLTTVLIVTILAVFAPFIAPYPAHAGKFVNFAEANQMPSLQYLLGTDVVGRDVLSRILFGFRFSLSMGVIVLVLVVPPGVVLGLVAGYWKGKWIDTIIMRITDVFLAVPPLVLALAIASVLRPSLFNAMLAVSLMWWPWYARLVYGVAASIRTEFFVQAAEVTGASKAHILFREILPNCMAPILTKISLDMGWVILLGASLSFVGLGVQPPTPGLGTMVADGAKYMPESWWIAVFPAIAIVIVVLGFNLLGDGLRDVLSVGEV